MAGLQGLSPQQKELEIEVAILVQARDENNRLLYTEEQVRNFDTPTRKQLVQGQKRKLLREAIVKQNNDTLKLVDEEIAKQQGTLNKLLDEADDPDILLRDTKIQIVADLHAQGKITSGEVFFTDQEIDQKVDELLEKEKNKDPEETPPLEKTPPEPGEKDGAGKPLGEDESYPSVTVVMKEGRPQSPSPDVLGNGADGLTTDQINHTVPPIAPIGSLATMSLFMEPISRQMFVLIVANPVGFFYIGLNTPCAYPIIVPPFYPVVPVGPPPAGAIGLAFIDPSSKYCGGSAPMEEELLINLGVPPIDIEALKASIDPCDPRLSPEQLFSCLDALNQQMRNILGPMPIPPEVKKIMDSIQERTIVPVPRPVPNKELSPKETITITTEEGVDEFDFSLDIIE